MPFLLDHQIPIGGSHVSLLSMIVAAVVLVAGFVVASLLSSRISKMVASGGSALRWRATIARLVGYAIRVLAISMALQLSGIEVAKVLAAVAVVAVGIGIAMQKVAENFVSGLILLAERSIREGDIIEFDGVIARIQHMGIRATVAQTLDDEEIIVPNSLLTQNAVKNMTLSEELYRLRVRVGVAYSSDMTKVQRSLLEAAESMAWRSPAHEPVVLLLDFGSSSVDFEVSVWTHDVWSLRKGQSALRLAVWNALQAASITIPFPQLDVHFESSPAGPISPQVGPRSSVP